MQPESRAQAGKFSQPMSELPASAQVTLTQALASLAAAPLSARPDTPLLVQLAEHVAIRFALERYERGDVRINTVVELLERMKREIKALRKVLAAHEKEMDRAGVEVESHADVLDRQFWASLPPGAKNKILNSPEAWAIPPRNVRQFVEELLTRGDYEAAGAVLFNYVTCVHNPDREARRKTCLGLADLADLYARTIELLLNFTIRHVGEQLNRESEQDLRTLLSASFVRFTHEAGAHRQYTGVQQALVAMESVEKYQPALADTLWPKIRAGTRLHEFIEEALRAPSMPGELLGVLRRLPYAAVEHLAGRMNRCARQDERDRLVELARGTGAEGIAHLRRTLATRPVSEAVPTVGLLSQLDTKAMEDILLIECASGSEPIKIR
jgi:hypothetical protein